MRRNIQRKNQIIIKYIQDNIKEITTIAIIFLIGIIFGIMLINNVKQEGKEELETYVSQFVENIKQENNLDTFKILKEDTKRDLLLGIIIWIAGSTVVGIPIVYGIIGYRGFCFGYTIGAFIAILGAKQGILISIIGVALQNLVFIPSIILIAASGMKLYKTTIKDKKRENIKLGICKHSIISVIGLIGIMLSSIIEVCISTNLLIFFAKYI